MMVRKTMTLQELRREGLQALLDRLGPADAIRFLQSYDAGRGDYTRDRHQWLKEVTVCDVKRNVEQHRDR